MKETNYYLIVFNNRSQRIELRRRFTNENRAVKEYARLEKKYRGHRDHEIVLIGADSLATIRKTHSRYFDGETRQASKPDNRKRKADPFPPIVKSGRSS